jgi:hypothetical protein
MNRNLCYEVNDMFRKYLICLSELVTKRHLHSFSYDKYRRVRNKMFVQVYSDTCARESRVYNVSYRHIMVHVSRQKMFRTAT